MPAEAVQHRPHDWTTIGDQRLAPEQRTWHTNGRGNRNAYTTSTRDRHGRPAVSVAIMGSPVVSPAFAERLAADLAAAAADARTRFSTDEGDCE